MIFVLCVIGRIEQAADASGAGKFGVRAAVRVRRLELHGLMLPLIVLLLLLLTNEARAGRIGLLALPDLRGLWRVGLTLLLLLRMLLLLLCYGHRHRLVRGDVRPACGWGHNGSCNNIGD